MTIQTKIRHQRHTKRITRFGKPLVAPAPPRKLENLHIFRLNIMNRKGNEYLHMLATRHCPKHGTKQLNGKKEMRRMIREAKLLVVKHSHSEDIDDWFSGAA